MTIVERVQQYRTESQMQTHTTFVVGPFTVFLHATEGAIESNVAFPHMPTGDAPEQNWQEALEAVRAAFVTQGRIPAMRWIADYAPELASLAQVQGFSEHSRETLMVCTPTILRHPPLSQQELTFGAITDASPLDEVRENLDVNAFGFDPATAQPATEEEAGRFRATLQTARAFMARLNGHPAGAGMYTTPLAGVTELTGIATLQQYRGRGIAAVLTAYMADAAFTQGCDLAFLTTANPVARRAYERAGFQPLGEELLYVASPAGMR